MTTRITPTSPLTQEVWDSVAVECIRQSMDPEALEFDDSFLHNFGDLDPIPVGARALCGALSQRTAPGETEPLRTECCPICFSLTP
jgi:hypothetical protein